jgi:arylsulfatase A-like enzyme
MDNRRRGTTMENVGTSHSNDRPARSFQSFGKRRWTTLVAAVTVLAVLGSVAAGATRSGSSPQPTALSPTATASDHAVTATATAARRPSIVLILTDDQRWDTLWAMGHVQEVLKQHGVTFKNAFVTNSLCCPSRTTILTGKYSHSTGVYSNAPPHGGFPSFHDRTTIATVLHGAGYRTALIGKYLNAYRAAAHAGYVPPGWDRWFAFAGDNGHYYSYDVTDNGRIRHFGSRPADYSTNVLANQAVGFIRNTRGPLFLYFTPSAPHLPAIPAPQDRTAFSAHRFGWPPNFNEQDVSDKPTWVRTAPLRPAGYVASNRLRQYRTLLAVDRAVARIVRALRDTGRLSTTFIAFMGDNGFLWGEHRLGDKRAVYEESIRVPLVIRYDPLTRSARTDDHLVLNMDLAPTWATLGAADVRRERSQSPAAVAFKLGSLADAVPRRAPEGRGGGPDHPERSHLLRHPNEGLQVRRLPDSRAGAVPAHHRPIRAAQPRPPSPVPRPDAVAASPSQPHVQAPSPGLHGLRVDVSD